MSDASTQALDAVCAVGRFLGLGAAIACALATVILVAAPAARAQDCMSILSLLQQGRSPGEISRLSGMSPAQVIQCRRQLSQPTFVGPAGAPPVNAAGSPPVNAAGGPPIGAAGRPPIGAAGGPPVGAAGAPPVGAAGPPPVGRQVQPLH